MSRLNFIIVCDEAEIVGEKKKLNISGVFDSIYSEGFPALHAFLTVVVNFEIEPGQHSHTITIKQDQNEVFKLSRDFNSENPRHQFIHRIENLPLPGPGKYTIDAYLDGALVGNSYFFAKLIPNNNG